jgi:uncharacterized membrane protein
MSRAEMKEATLPTPPTTKLQGVTPPVDATSDNIKAIADLERRALDEASPGERVGHAISRFAGTMIFIAAQMVAMAAWIVWNGVGPPRLRFDPYPYALLAFIVSFEGVLIATFVLIAQNRMSRHSDARDQLHLQINLLAEQEMTLMLKLLRRIAQRLDIPETAEEVRTEKVAAETDVHDLAARLRQEVSETERK